MGLQFIDGLQYPRVFQALLAINADQYLQVHAAHHVFVNQLQGDLHRRAFAGEFGKIGVDFEIKGAVDKQGKNGQVTDDNGLGTALGEVGYFCQHGLQINQRLFRLAGGIVVLAQFRVPELQQNGQQTKNQQEGKGDGHGRGYTEDRNDGHIGERQGEHADHGGKRGQQNRCTGFAVGQCHRPGVILSFTAEQGVGAEYVHAAGDAHRQHQHKAKREHAGVGHAQPGADANGPETGGQYHQQGP